MFHIKSVEIEGFWGKHSLENKFFPDVNIFIGKNGTGKTTYINLLQGVLQVDFPLLVSLEFNKILIRLGDESRTRTIKVEKTASADSIFEKITFKVGIKSYSFSLPVFDENIDYKRTLLRRPKLAEEFTALRTQIENLVQVSSLSVHRSSEQSFEGDEYVTRRQQLTKSAIDHRLEYLMSQFRNYQLALEIQARKVASIFEKDVLVSMLYNEQFDKWDLQDALSIELSKEKSELKKAYKELKAFDDEVSKKIDAHIKALNQILTRLKNPNEGIKIEYLFPLPLLRRTQHIIQLTKTAEEQKQEIFQFIRQYIEIIQSFITDKEFKITSEGELQLFKEDKKISISQLSSGEKQLLILLTETLLQKHQPYIFIADEPEISLHIEWQAEVISSIKLLNQNAQVIVATHSPEIAGGWKKNIIDMEDIVDG